MPSQSETSIIVFRLDELEKKLGADLGNLAVKLDKLLTDQAHIHTKIALNEQKSVQIERDVRKLEEDSKALESTISKVQITLAERVGYGMLGGAGIAGVAEILRLVILGV